MHELADRWLVECVKAAGDSFRERYHEEKYAKNVTGAIRDAGFTASLGPDPTKGTHKTSWCFTSLSSVLVRAKRARRA